MRNDFLVVGIGASAGGLEALERLFRGLPAAIDAALVVVQHLSPDHKSLMADLMSKHTSLPVRDAVDGQEVLPNTVTMAPPHANLEVSMGRLKFRDRSASHVPNLPINLFLTSLAENFGERSVGIVLSGTGSDGRLGVQSIKDAGGLVLAQDPTTARFDGMPLAAISTGRVDFVLPPEAMAQELLNILQHGPMPSMLSAADEVALSEVHRLLLGVSGIDFSEYKPGTVRRRVARRMALAKLSTLRDYLNRLEQDTTELQALARELLIHVTQFFRDKEVWAGLQKHVLAGVVERAGTEPVRVWVPGCSTGQEAYSLAMLLAEANPRGGFKVFATDIDAQALDSAAAGRYVEADLLGVSPERLERFFRRNGDSWEVDRELRRRIVFAPHNIAKDPPFTRLDVASCRNLLIYLAAPLQKRVLSSLAFALKTDGVLLLGNSESLGDASHRFRTIDAQLKLFQRLPGPRELLPESAPALPSRVQGMAPPTDLQQAADAATRLLLDRAVPAAVLTTEKLELLRVFGNAERLLSLPNGPATLSLISMLPTNLHTITSIAAHKALTANTEVLMATAEVAGVRAVRIQPFVAGRTSARYLLITYERAVSVSASAEAAPVSEDSSRQLAELQRELLFVQESLQATIEELETSNEELQATNEELLASNEELQSTNEELQSVNEELNTVNAEHQAKIRELLQTNADLDNFFNASALGTIFLDEQLNIRRFTPAVTQQFSLLERDLGRPIEHITHHFQHLHLLEDLKRVLRTAQSLESEVTTQGGHRYLMRLSPYLTESRQVRGVVASFVDVTALRNEQAVRHTLQSVIDSLGEQVALVDPGGEIRFVNQAWLAFAAENGARPGEASVGVGANYLAACDGVPEVKSALQAVLSGEQDRFELEYPCHSPTAQRWFVMRVKRLSDGSGVVVSHFDVTFRKLLQPEGARA